MPPLPFWVWFTLARRIHEGQLHRSDRKGAPRNDLPPYRFGERITLPQTYWDGGAWVIPSDPISTGDLGGARSRLYVWLQSRGYGRAKPLFVSPRFFPRGTGLNWRYELLRRRFRIGTDKARLVISIEDERKYTVSSLKVARHRERQALNDLLSKPGKNRHGVRIEGFRALREMFPHTQTIRVPFTLDSIWPPALVTFFEERNLLGKTFSVPSRPPSL